MYPKDYYTIVFKFNKITFRETNYQTTINELRMKKAILLSAVLFIAASAVFSQTKQESIRELIHLTQTDSMMEKVYKSIMPTIMKQISTEMKDSSALDMTKELMNSMMQSGKEISKKIMDEDVAGIYEKYYTEKEIQDLVTFYKSSTGRKVIEKAPEMQGEIMTIVMQKMMPEIRKNTTEMAIKLKEELEKRNAALKKEKH